MSRLSRLEQYPIQYMRLAEAIALHQKRVTLSFASKTLAFNMRREFYMFRRLLTQSMEYELLGKAADNIVISLRDDPPGSWNLYFSLRDNDPINLAIDKALQEQAAGIIYSSDKETFQPSTSLRDEIELEEIEHNEIELPKIEDESLEAPDGRDLSYLKDHE